MPWGKSSNKIKMANAKLSQLIKIISAEHIEGLNHTPRSYDTKKNYRGGKKSMARQEAYRNKKYMQQQNLNKRGYG